MNDTVIKLENVSKYYKLYDSPKDRLKEAFSPFGKKYHKEFYALNGISFELKRGECLGIIGKNGAGKSTLLKIISHVIPPSSGKVSVDGTISALLELGTGFNPEFTGMQNIFFYGTILGFKKGEIEEKISDIVKFADIGEYIDQPVKTYSSGMFVRLAFAIQTSLKPDILIVDEVLSVGDIFFQQKCHRKIEELLSNNTSLVIVSHDVQLIEKYSTNAVLLDNGTNIFYGHPHKAIQKYFSLSDNYSSSSAPKEVGSHHYSGSFSKTNKKGDKVIQNWPPQEAFTSIQNLEAYGRKDVATITKFAVCNSTGIVTSNFEIGEKAHFYYEVNTFKDIDTPIGAVILINALNIAIHGKDTLQYPNTNELFIKHVKAGSTVRFKQEFKLTIAPGEYTFSIGFATIDHENFTIINKLELNERDSVIKKIIRVPQAGRILINSGGGNIKLPFHGYTDLEGDYQLYSIE